MWTPQTTVLDAGLIYPQKTRAPRRHRCTAALPYCAAKIVDIANASRELPSGEVGELMIRSPVVMQGVYGDDAATSEAIEPGG